MRFCELYCIIVYVYNCDRHCLSYIIVGTARLYFAVHLGICSFLSYAKLLHRESYVGI